MVRCHNNSTWFIIACTTYSVNRLSYKEDIYTNIYCEEKADPIGREGCPRPGSAPSHLFHEVSPQATSYSRDRPGAAPNAGLSAIESFRKHHALFPQRQYRWEHPLCRGRWPASLGSTFALPNSGRSSWRDKAQELGEQRLVLDFLMENRLRQSVAPMILPVHNSGTPLRRNLESQLAEQFNQRLNGPEHIGQTPNLYSLLY
jgi:hypothetical protein